MLSFKNKNQAPTQDQGCEMELRTSNCSIRIIKMFFEIEIIHAI